MICKYPKDNHFGHFRLNLYELDQPVQKPSMLWCSYCTLGKKTYCTMGQKNSFACQAAFFSSFPHLCTSCVEVVRRGQHQNTEAENCEVGWNEDWVLEQTLRWNWGDSFPVGRRPNNLLFVFFLHSLVFVTPPQLIPGSLTCFCSQSPRQGGEDSQCWPKSSADTICTPGFTSATKQMGWHKTCRPEIPQKMSGLGYDLCFFVGEDTSLTGALIQVPLTDQHWHACVDVQAVKGDDQATVEELVSQGQDLTRSDDVGQASIVVPMA